MNVWVTEILKREVDIEANNTVEALEKLEELYNEGEITLDYSDLADVGFSSCGITRNETLILNEITDFCKECPSNNCCPKDECVLHRIERVVLG